MPAASASFLLLQDGITDVTTARGSPTSSSESCPNSKLAAPKPRSRSNKLTFLSAFPSFANSILSLLPAACSSVPSSEKNFGAHNLPNTPNTIMAFSTKFRTNVFLGERIRYLIPSQFRKRHNSISAYYELSTSDLYLVSYATNHYLSLWDILSLSFGLKFELF
jgi:hypothetical protein